MVEARFSEKSTASIEAARGNQVSMQPTWGLDGAQEVVGLGGGRGRKKSFSSLFLEGNRDPALGRVDAGRSR